MTPGADGNKRLDGEEKGLDSKSSSTLDRKTSKSEKIPKSASRELGHNAGKSSRDGTAMALIVCAPPTREGFAFELWQDVQTFSLFIIIILIVHADASD